MNPAPTPRSDADCWDTIAGAVRCKANTEHAYVPATLARTLERELTEARATLLAREGELDSMSAALAAAKATAREAMEEADHYKRIFKSNGASMELMASRIPTGGQVIDAVIQAAAVIADSPGVLVWSANAAEQIEAALAKIAEEGQAQP